MIQCLGIIERQISHPVAVTSWGVQRPRARDWIIVAMAQQLKNIWQRRDLLYYMVRFEMKAENKNKVLGFVWSFLAPLLLLLVYIVLVHYIFGRGGPQFPVLLFIALLSWRWFTSALSRSVTSITSKSGLIQSTC